MLSITYCMRATVHAPFRLDCQRLTKPRSGRQVALQRRAYAENGPGRISTIDEGHFTVKYKPQDWNVPAQACATRLSASATRFPISMPVNAKSTSGARPETISAIARPEPQPMVQPSVPWPVLRNRLL